MQNTCQAVVNSFCSKYKVMKSVTASRAIRAAVGYCLQHREDSPEGVEQELHTITPSKMKHPTAAVQ